MRKQTATALLLCIMASALLAGCAQTNLDDALETETWAPQLSRAAKAQWHDNGARYELHYVGRTVTFRGKARHIGTKEATIMRDIAWHDRIKCRFASQGELASLRDGQMVAITGRLGYPDDAINVGVTNCRLIRTPAGSPE